MSASGGTTGVPGGWYQDPNGTPRLRYWDGAAWTDHYAEPGAPAPPAAAPPPYAATPAPPPPLAAAGAWSSSGAPPAPPGVWGSSGAPSQGPAPKSGMSGCLKALVIIIVVFALGAAALIGTLVVVGGHVVHHITVNVAGTSGRPGSLPSSASDYSGERTQDRVAGSNGVVTMGSLTVTATNWARTTQQGVKLVCGDVTFHRPPVTSNNPLDAALLLGGEFAWQMVAPSGATASLDTTTSTLSALSSLLTTNEAGGTGTMCFADPGEHGQYAVLWQPRLLQAARAVWIFKLS